jgi:hypothetical protein
VGEFGWPSGLHGCDALLNRALATDENDRHPPPLVLKAGLELNAIDARHLHIDQQDGRPEKDGFFKKSVSAFKRLHVVTQVLKAPAQRSANRVVIVDEVQVFSVADLHGRHGLRGCETIMRTARRKKTHPIG